MAAITVTPLYDPFSHHHNYYLSLPQISSSSSGGDANLMLDLLAVDHLIDSYTPLKREESLWNELLAVDLECGRAHVRRYTNIATAPALRGEKEMILDLLRTDREVDNVTGRVTHGKKSSSNTSMELIDSYARRVHSTMERIADNNKLHKDDDVIMMHLLAMDEYVDGSKRSTKFIESTDCVMIGEMYMLDCEISGAKRRTLLVEDLQCLLDVDRFIDGCAKK